MKIGRTLRAIGLAGVIGLYTTACNHKPTEAEVNPATGNEIEGIVLKESGTVVNRQIGLYGNAHAKNDTYAIQFRANGSNIYTFEVIEMYPYKLEALSLAIEEGTKIRMPNYDFHEYLKGTVGSVRSDKLEVLAK